MTDHFVDVNKMVGANRPSPQELKPCPWCRVTESLMELFDVFDGGYTAHIHCSKCGACGPEVWENTGIAAVRESRKKWNQRTT